MRIHRNLHNAKAGGPQWVHTERGRVSEYLDSILLVSVTTRIQSAGRAKCEVRNVRSVCAYFDGEPVTELHPNEDTGRWYRMAFDPRMHSQFRFIDAHGHLLAWNRARAAELRSDGSCWLLDPHWS